MTRNDPFWEAASLSIAVVLSCALGGSSLSISIENLTAPAARLAMISNLVLQAATIGVAIWTRSASAVWVVRTVVPAVLIGLNLLLLDPQRRRVVVRPQIPLGLGRPFWRFSLLSWGSGLIGILVFSRSEIFILQIFHKHEALGLFALAYGLSQVITAPADAMLHSLLPAVSGVLAAWPERAAAAFDRATRVSALLCGGIAAIVIPALAFAVPVVYGRSFTSSAWLFVPMAIVSALQSVNNPVTAFVTGRQRGGLILRASVGALVVDVVLAFVLIPGFGAWGAVVANVAGQLVAIVWMMVTEPLALPRSVRGMISLYRAFLVGLAIGLVAFGLGAITQRSSYVAAVVVSSLVGTILYLVAVRVTRSGLTPADRKVLVESAAVRVRPHMTRLLNPITTQGGA